MLLLPVRPPAALCGLLLFAVASQGTPPSGVGRGTSVVGEAVDLACRFAPRPDETHACTKECLKDARLPAVLDEASGKAYLVFDASRRPASERLAGYAGGKVRVSGKTYDAKGVRVIVADGVAAPEAAKPESAPSPSPPTEPEKPRNAVLQATVVNVLDAVEAAAKNQKHTCTARCVEAGGPIGLVDLGTGRLYLAIAPDRKSARPLLLPYGGLKVRATGRIAGSLIELVKVEKA